MHDHRIDAHDSLIAALTAQVSSLQGHLAMALGEIRALQARDQARADALEGTASTAVGLVFSFLVLDNHNNMPPRRSSATARAAATTARAAAAAAAPMTVAAVEHLIEARVSATLANHETLLNSTNGHGNGSHNSGIGNRGTIRTPQLALMCGRMFLKESDEVEKYIGGLPDMIRGNVMSYRPQTIEEAIEFANDQMDQKLITITERDKTKTISAIEVFGNGAWIATWNFIKLGGKVGWMKDLVDGGLSDFAGEGKGSKNRVLAGFGIGGKSLYKLGCGRERLCAQARVGRWHTPHSIHRLVRSNTVECGDDTSVQGSESVCGRPNSSKHQLSLSDQEATVFTYGPFTRTYVSNSLICNNHFDFAHYFVGDMRWRDGDGPQDFSIEPCKMAHLLKRVIRDSLIIARRGTKSGEGQDFREFAISTTPALMWARFRSTHILNNTVTLATRIYLFPLADGNGHKVSMPQTSRFPNLDGVLLSTHPLRSFSPCRYGTRHSF
ncbi:hypothetical protein Tco_0960256 [Tanacetum coccineum]